MPEVPTGDHEAYMRLALEQAQRSPPKPTNYRVGAVVVNPATNDILATGYTLELPGNTHAEQCCFLKLAERHGVSEENLKGVLPPDLVLYTTVEPCSKRLSGILPCVERVLRLAGTIRTVYVGIMEPETLGDAGITLVHVPGLEKEILEVATAGHAKD
ncbi:hypothetical protein N0V88_005297 [Collariella sp. IMI 366227]|nr:hypothetical protein N0V88_005297 [Collariella sp. IMI 366227]